LISRLNQKNIFLFDGVGAALSLIVTGAILPRFANQLGVPINVFYFLALFPLLIGVYSLVIYKVVDRPRPLMLAIVMAANILYCFVSGRLIFTLEGITGLGQLVLRLELIVLLLVLLIEMKVYKRCF
jgi:hypothetical protein